MNRKLQHTLKALSATAAVFTVMMLAGGPTMPAAPATMPIIPPAVAAQLTGDSGPVDGTIDASEPSQPTASQRRQRRHSRELLALPYFSFAQGLRRTRS